ncbi:mite allergen Der p 7-like [Periplaneta americana]|uniref:mite allergen Der p 7-like n=1 Tax=Periplaneta americana TaxID=6978 RepID=UPI0037E9121B
MQKFVISWLVLAVCSYALSGANTKVLPKRSRAEIVSRIESEADKIVDAVVDLLRKYANTHNLEPMQLPNMQESFSVDLGIVTLDGDLYLTNGWLHDLTTMVRNGEASVKTEGSLVHISTNVEFSTLHMLYDYSVEFMGLNPTGLLKGTADDLILYVDLTANLDTYKTTLGSLGVLTVGQISIQIEGGDVEEAVVNAISGLIEPYFENDILAFMEEKMTSTLAEALEDFDIRDIIGY